MKQKIKGSWKDPSPMGEPPQESENTAFVLRLLLQSIRKEELDGQSFWESGGHSSSLKLLHFSGLRGPKVYILRGRDYGRRDQEGGAANRL